MKTEKGFTLVELLMMMLLFPILFLSVYTSLNMANTVFRSGNIYAQLNENTRQTLRYLSREIGQTSPNISPSHLSITTDGSNNSVITFQIPVDYDNDGDVVTNNVTPVVEWGIYDQANQKASGRLGGWARYQVSNNQLTRQVLDSSLTAVSGLSRVIANNVQSFSVSKSSNQLTMNITVLAGDTTGGGSTSRTFQTSFASQTMLRNAVS
jgi:type II secretory pathway component PulJ